MENNTGPIEETPITITGEELSQISLRQKHYWAGRAHREAGRLELAIASFSEYAEVLDDADKVYPWWWIADIELELGQRDMALASYRTALSFSPIKAQQLRLKGFIKSLENPAS